MGETTSKALVSIYEQWQAAAIDQDTARELWAIVLETAGVQGETLGALSFNTYAEVSTGVTVSTKAATASNPATKQRITEALSTVLAGEPEQIAMRLERIGFADPVTMAQEAFHNVMKKDGRVEGWVRGLEADACQLCRWWWREGKLWNADHVMPTHTGCTCHQVPAFKTKTNGAWGNVNTQERIGSGRLRGGGLRPKRA